MHEQVAFDPKPSLVLYEEYLCIAIIKKPAEWRALRSLSDGKCFPKDRLVGLVDRYRCNVFHRVVHLGPDLAHVIVVERMAVCVIAHESLDLVHDHLGVQAELKQLGLVMTERCTDDELVDLRQVCEFLIYALLKCSRHRHVQWYAQCFPSCQFIQLPTGFDHILRHRLSFRRIV